MTSPEYLSMMFNPCSLANIHVMNSHISSLQTVDEPYLRTGPGSPGYTRASPRSPAAPSASAASPAGSCAAPGPGHRAAKRKSRDTEAAGTSGVAGTSAGKQTTRCKRPKVAASNWMFGPRSIRVRHSALAMLLKYFQCPHDFYFSWIFLFYLKLMSLDTIRVCISYLSRHNQSWWKEAGCHTLPTITCF